MKPAGPVGPPQPVVSDHDLDFGSPRTAVAVAPSPHRPALLGTAIGLLFGILGMLTLPQLPSGGRIAGYLGGAAFLGTVLAVAAHVTIGAWRLAPGQPGALTGPQRDLVPGIWVAAFLMGGLAFAGVARRHGATRPRSSLAGGLGVVFAVAVAVVSMWSGGLR